MQWPKAPNELNTESVPAAGDSFAGAPLEPRSEADRTRQNWRLAAILFIGGGLGAIPSDMLYVPKHPPTIFLLPALALVSGLFCWVMAARLSARALHAMVIIATLEIALTAHLADPRFAAYYILVGLFAGYVFRSRRDIAFHVAFASLAALAPIVYEPDSARQTLLTAFVLIPTLLLTAASFAFLREQLEASEQRYRGLAERDPLTGIGNYRMLGEWVPRLLARQRRDGGRVTVIVIDLNDFKLVNDTHGHQRGDEVLRQVGSELSGAIRPGDLAVRQGGDEFCVVAPGLSDDAGDALCQRLTEAIGSIMIAEHRLGACIGRAVFPEDGNSLEQLLNTADDRLLESKARKPDRPRVATLS
jgi:diguanylate cyclase (GGDEF)-like protein